MTRWKQDETKFTVSVNTDRHVKVCRIPKPIIEMLGDPKLLTFSIKKDKIVVEAG